MSSSSAHALHASLLRPPILHILRAAGFHSTRPSVLDTLADLAARYLLLLAARTASHAASNYPEQACPSITDARMALADCGVLAPTLTAAEEAWKEALRRPLWEIGGEGALGEALREKERSRRDDEDVSDVRDFLNWIRGEQNREIGRVAGLLEDSTTAAAAAQAEAGKEKEDFLSVLKKKHSKTGEASRYRGTALGGAADDRVVRIEGGPCERLADWRAYVLQHGGGAGGAEARGGDRGREDSAGAADRADRVMLEPA
ncbi:hypothetical protein B0A49_06544 [Cryomyces minteri]|uniref:Bromodomain associated domain-containing protein n=1 Tax=Cryomyces minteri TaxID=331657 RepID=A0A4U0WT57_9PEZI|nr:hypothetical protein B0A49_06544 [Cryomyces minteri]